MKTRVILGIEVSEHDRLVLFGEDYILEKQFEVRIYEKKLYGPDIRIYQGVSKASAMRLNRIQNSILVGG